MLNKIIMTGLIVSTVFFSGCIYQNNSQTVLPTAVPTVSESPKPTTETSVQNTMAEIRMSENGFVPDAITIKTGTTVKFVNDGTSEIWPASAPHPQHTDLPGFDSLKGVKPGETYEYTFTKAGTWKFHNHLKSSQFGRVIVE